MEELPPRTRRILFPHLKRGHVFGTTSAYAENTPPTNLPAYQVWNYLRVRGEYLHSETIIRACRELPPRTRRILTGSNAETMELGTTSAYAENTLSSVCYKFFERNYLRVRGEYGGPTNRPTIAAELPPRTRRIQGFAVFHQP